MMKYEEVADLDRLIEFILDRVATEGIENKFVSRIKKTSQSGWTEELCQSLRQYIESVIPEGDYCYTLESNPDGDFPKTIPCPFWDRDESKHYQEAGYCHLLQHGDWEFNDSKVYVNCKTGEKQTANEIGLPLSLLWDQCKECDVNPHRGFED